MTAETITNTIRHIFRFFVPPLLNIILLSIVVGESLGVGAGVLDLIVTVKQILASYIDTASKLVVNTGTALLPNINAENVARFNPQAIVQTIVTSIGSATTFFGFLAMILFIFIAFVIDGITLLVSRQAGNLIWLIGRLVRSHRGRQSTASIGFVGYVSYICKPARLEVAELYARDLFTRRETPKPLDNENLQGMVRAWLSQNAKNSFWFDEHNSAEERRVNLKLAVDYLRIYTLLSAALCLYSSFSNPSIRDIVFPLAMLVLWGIFRLAYVCAELSLHNYDLNEFYYYRTALASTTTQTATDSIQIA